jgi:cell wall-associated NlpC family hydrolase
MPGILAVALAVGVAGSPASATTTGSTWVTARRTAPERTEIRDAAGSLVAEFTDGARTVVIRGPARTWTERDVTAKVTTDRWVRLLPLPFDGRFDTADRAWLSAAIDDDSPDVLAIAFQYVKGAPDVRSGGLRIAGDAAYGPSAGADFNDYLGIPWRYGTSTDRPETAQFGALDCSGFVRQVFAYRLGLPATINVVQAGAALPRRAADQLIGAQGRITIANAGRQLTSFGSLRPGDLVFFDASTADGTAIDHVGIYVGTDAGGRHRFISSRRGADGPTIGDVGGASILDGTGYWARAFRAVRRL